MCLADTVCSVLVQRVLHCIIDILIEIKVRVKLVYYRREMGVEKTKAMRISNPNTVYDKSKTTEKCGIFKKKNLGSLITNVVI